MSTEAVSTLDSARPPCACTRNLCTMLYGIDYGKFRETMVGHAGTRISCRVRGGAWRVGPSVPVHRGPGIADLDVQIWLLGSSLRGPPVSSCGVNGLLIPGCPCSRHKGKGSSFFLDVCRATKLRRTRAPPLRVPPGTASRQADSFAFGDKSCDATPASCATAPK